MWFSFDLVFFIYRLSTFPERFMYKIVEFLQPYFKQDAYLMFDCLYDNNAECIDTFTLFQYLQKNNIPSYYLVNKNHNSLKKIKKVGRQKNIITTDKNKKIPLKLIFCLLRTHTVITSFGHDNSRFENFLYKNKKINYIFSDHGIFFMKLFPLNYYTSSRFNFFIVNNELETQMILNNSKWTENRLIKCGLFRFDKLKREQNKKNIFIMFTWRKSRQNDYFKKIESLLNNEILKQFIFANDVKIKFALHHVLNPELDYEKLFIDNQNVEIINLTDISEQVSKTSLFITDFSSIAFDFMYLDIPVIFYRFDADLDEKTKEYESIDYAMTKDKYLYNCCYSEQDTVKTIIKYVQNGFTLEDENKEKNKQFFTYSQKNSICKNFVEHIERLNKKEIING